MRKIKHDEKCPGCATKRQFREGKAAAVDDYLRHCERCGKSINGGYEHCVQGKNYHAKCANTLSDASEAG